MFPVFGTFSVNLYLSSTKKFLNSVLFAFKAQNKHYFKWHTLCIIIQVW